jgi:hypothetical protein
MGAWSWPGQGHRGRRLAGTRWRLCRLGEEKGEARRGLIDLVTGRPGRPGGRPDARRGDRASCDFASAERSGGAWLEMAPVDLMARVKDGLGDGPREGSLG